MKRSRLCSLAALLALRGGADPVRVEWNGHEAWRLDNGRLEAVAVPALGGRVMRFGKIGGDNWLWTGGPEKEAGDKTQFWGGDKTYFGPHPLWKFTMPATWPPPPPDRLPHRAEVLPDGRLRMTSPVWETVGAAIERTLGFDDRGDLVLEHRAAPVPGARQPGALWTITQVVPADAFFVPLDPASPYKDNVFWFAKAHAGMAGAEPLGPDLLRLTPPEGAAWKLGAAPPRPALAAVRGAQVFLQRADPQPGVYPGGPDRGGFSVEVYHHNLPGPGRYAELEFLSPLRRFDEGMTLTTRWSLRDFPQPPAPDELRALLGE